MQTFEILLISQSPRRRDILLDAGYKFFVDTVKVSELIKKNVNPLDAVQAIAREKLEAYLCDPKPLKSKDFLYITADTVVVLGDQILGKPKDATQAVKFLSSLSGQVHHVLTAVCVHNAHSQVGFEFVDTTEVQFKPLSKAQIMAYVETGDPMDKAGAYGIQGPANVFVQEIKGSYLNVMGLPLERLEVELAKRNWNVHRAKT